MPLTPATAANPHATDTHGVVPPLGLVCAQDVGLRQVDDPGVLEWAAHEHRIILTPDVNTMPAFAFDRIRRIHTMSSLFVVSQQAGKGPRDFGRGPYRGVQQP